MDSAIPVQWTRIIFRARNFISLIIMPNMMRTCRFIKPEKKLQSIDCALFQPLKAAVLFPQSTLLIFLVADNTMQILSDNIQFLTLGWDNKIQTENTHAH